MPKFLGGKRKPLLKKGDQIREIERTGTNSFPGLKILAVIGSKGGSGEFSQVVDLISQNESGKWLVVSVNPDFKHEEYWQDDPLVTYRVANWQYDDGLLESFEIAKSLEVDYLILCIGLGTRGYLYSRVDRALGFCDEVFVTINSTCTGSMCAVNLIKENGIEEREGSEKLRWIDLNARSGWPSI